MKKNMLLIIMLKITALLLTSCGQSSETKAALNDLYKPRPDKDVTLSPEYNFSSFAGTTWKTKVKVAIAESERYTGAPETKLLVPQRFDSTHPSYIPTDHMKIVSILPVSSVLRIERLLKDQGAWGGIQVEAVLLDGTNVGKVVFLDGFFLVGNRWSRGPASNTSWDADPEMLEHTK